MELWQVVGCALAALVGVAPGSAGGAAKHTTDTLLMDYVEG